MCTYLTTPSSYQGCGHLTSLNGLRFLVLDEADRMIEYGHFRELALILDRVNGMERHSARQTLIFSATLTLPRKSLEKKSHKKPVSGEETLGMWSGEETLGMWSGEETFYFYFLKNEI